MEIKKYIQGFFGGRPVMVEVSDLNSLQQIDHVYLKYEHVTPYIRKLEKRLVRALKVQHALYKVLESEKRAAACNDTVLDSPFR